MSSIHVLRKVPVHRLHESRDIAARRVSNEVVVVAHQAIERALDAVTIEGIRQVRQELSSVSIVLKDPALAVPSGHYVVCGSAELNTWWLGHTARILQDWFPVDLWRIRARL